jgi:hypothetical protein
MGKNLASTPRRKPVARPHAAPPPAPPIVVDDDPLAVGADAYDAGLDDISLDTDSLREAEEDLGISDWIDPDTGEPAEDTRHHIEDR